MVGIQRWPHTRLIYLKRKIAEYESQLSDPDLRAAAERNARQCYRALNLILSGHCDPRMYHPVCRTAHPARPTRTCARGHMDMVAHEATCPDLRVRLLGEE